MSGASQGRPGPSPPTRMLPWKGMQGAEASKLLEPHLPGPSAKVLAAEQEARAPPPGSRTRRALSWRFLLPPTPQCCWPSPG